MTIRPRCLVCRSLLAAFSMMATASSAGAGVIGVPGDFPTIQSAINAALDGDIVVVSPGTYNESLNFLSKVITVRSSGGSNVTTIDATGLNTTVVGLGAPAPGSVLEGFSITGG